MVTDNEIRENWRYLSHTIANLYPFLAGAVADREIQVKDGVIVLLFNKNEKILKKIAGTYLDKIQDAACEYFGEEIRADTGVTGY